MLGFRLETRQALVQALELVGGATDSIFPEVEALLSANTDYQEALKYVASRKKMERYQSVIDFLFCELHPEWKTACRRFYEGQGPQLKDMITPAQHAASSARMLKALEVARELHEEHRRKTWGWYCDQVEIALRAA